MTKKEIKEKAKEICGTMHVNEQAQMQVVLNGKSWGFLK